MPPTVIAIFIVLLCAAITVKSRENNEPVKPKPLQPSDEESYINQMRILEAKQIPEYN